MTRDVLNQKIDSLRNCIERIESKKPFTTVDLISNFDLQDIISINLERAVQICVDIASHVLSEKQGSTPSTMAESFIELTRNGMLSAEVSQSMVKAVGLRNLLVHEYSKIDWNIVSKVSNEHLDTFRQFAQEILQRV